MSFQNSNGLNQAQFGSTELRWGSVGLIRVQSGLKWAQLGSKGFKLTQVGSNRPKKKFQILREVEDEFREKQLNFMK